MVVFAVALALNRPEPQVRVVVAASDLPEGRVLVESDLKARELPASLAPEGAVSEPQSLVGQRLRVARSAGDPILPAHLGEERLELQPDERAVALLVSASQGLAGLLKPGDRVGLTLILTINQQTYAKYLAGSLRVLWVDPAFRRGEAPAGQAGGSARLFGGAGANEPPPESEPASRGLVVLAVPIAARSVAYDFSQFGVGSTTSPVYLVDLLPALSAQGAQFGLVLEPEKAKEVYTSGLALQSLVITPQPSPTPTPAPQP
jgi:pilus assembly protein CpaB